LRSSRPGNFSGGERGLRKNCGLEAPRDGRGLGGSRLPDPLLPGLVLASPSAGRGFRCGLVPVAESLPLLHGYKPLPVSPRNPGPAQPSARTQLGEAGASRGWRVPLGLPRAPPPRQRLSEPLGAVFGPPFHHGVGPGPGRWGLWSLAPIQGPGGGASLTLAPPPAFSHVLENTAFFGDVALRFPKIVHHYFDRNANWNYLVRWGISFCNQSGVFDQGSHAQLLGLMAQELGISERSPDYRNPFTTDPSEVSWGGEGRAWGSPEF
uniref:Coiled-coil domain containing 134 n=1 Tax=Monodelphis domestica TaxID=13616 RepID=A0A5F8GH56_MONDO